LAQDLGGGGADRRRVRRSVVREGYVDPTIPGLCFATPKGGNARGFVKEQHEACE
jgi:hypothetical protein